MIKTIMKHFILDYAINVVFEGVTKNFKKATKDFINSVSIGDTIMNVIVEFNGYIVYCDKAVVEDVFLLNALDATDKKVTYGFIHIKPIGVTRIVATNRISDSEIFLIEDYMQWIEESSDGVDDEFHGEFASPISVTQEAIIQAHL